MEIKAQLRTNQNLNKWSPYLNEHFPNDATPIAEKIFAALRVDPPDDLLASRRELFTAEAFVDTVVKPHPRLAAVELGKVRRRYALGSCAAEFVEVEITGRVLHSVAVESANPRAVLDAMGKLAIGGHPNIPYLGASQAVLT